MKSERLGTFWRLYAATTIIAVCACAANVCNGQGALREWTDSTGAYHIKASLESHDATQVKLRREDGKLIAMPISKLSADDQKYLKSLAGKDDAPKLSVGDLSKWQAAAAQAEREEREERNESEEQPTPKGNSAPVKRTPRYDGPFEINGKTVTLETNGQEIYVGSFAKAKRLNPATSPRPWKLKPQAQESAIPDNYHDMTVIPRRRGASVGMFYSNGSNFYVGFRSSDSVSGSRLGSNNLSVTRCDVSQGTSDTVTFFFNSGRLYDVTKDGALALANIEIEPQGVNLEDPFLAIMELGSFVDGDQRDPLAVFCPYYKPQQQQNNPANPALAALNLRKVYIQVENACMVDSARILSKCDSECTLWDLRTCNAIYSIKCNNHFFAVDPTRTYFVLADSLGLGCYDVETGENLGYVRLLRNYSNGNSLSWRNASIAFSPSGKKLAFYAFNHVNIIDLASGKAVNSFPIPDDMRTDLTWSSDDYLLIGSYCFDVASGAPVAFYSSGLTSSAYGRVALNNIVWSYDYGQINALTLPQDETIAQTKGKSLPELFALYPGASVSIKCELNGLLDENQVLEAVKKRLPLFGLNYDPKSEVVLLATTKDSGEREEATIESVEVRDLGGASADKLPPGIRSSLMRPTGKVSESVDVELVVYRQSIAILINGKVVKEVSDVTVGDISGRRDDSKTIKQQIQELNKPDVAFFNSASIPFYASKGNGDTAARTIDIRNGVEEPRQ